MYGEIAAPFEYNSERNLIKIQKFKGGILYNRTTGQKEIQKRIYSSRAGLSLMPVEPFNCPKLITSNLMLELGRTLVLPPNGVKKIFLKFPVEIGVIVNRENKVKVIDIFTDLPPKYALYGDLKMGDICRYHRSDVYVKPPKVEPFREGIGKVIIRNATPEWRDVSKLVFHGIAMKIFHDHDHIIFSAKAKILDDEKVETSFDNKPWIKGMTKSHDMLTAKTFPLLTSKFMMEGGY